MGKSSEIRIPFCTINLAQKERKKELTPREWVGIFKLLRDKVSSWVLLGVEPTEYPQLTRLLGRMSRMRLNFTLCSSMVGITPRQVESWMDAGLRSLSISLDGLDFFSEENFVDEESFINSKAGARYVSYRFPKYFKKFIKFTLSKKSAQYLPSILEVARKSRWHVCINILSGRGEYSFAEADAEEVGLIADYLVEMKENGFPLTDPVEFYQAFPTLGLSRDFKCKPGSSLFLDADGSIGICFDYLGEIVSKLSLQDIGTEEWVEACKKDIEQCSGCYWNCNWLSSEIARGNLSEAVWI